MYYIQDYEYYVILINIIALLCLTENGRQMRNFGIFLKWNQNDIWNDTSLGIWLKQL